MTRKYPNLGVILTLFVFAISWFGITKMTGDMANMGVDANGSTSLEQQNAETSILKVEVVPSVIKLSEIPEYVQITVTNESSDKEFKGGYHYAIQHSKRGKWINVHNPGVPDESLKIQPGEQIVFDYIQLNPKGHRYRAGTYRVIYYDSFGEFVITK